MKDIPFTIYDFLAYLSSGAVIVASLDYVFGYRWLLGPVGASLALLLVLAAYIAGHAVAHFSSLAFERGLVKRVLGEPSLTLMDTAAPGRIRRFLFHGYYEPLPAGTRERVVAKARERGCNGTGKELFLHARACVARDKAQLDRLDLFLNLYGFSRNVSFALLCAALLGLSGLFLTPTYISPWWLVTVALAAVMMLYRYLKFFREYSLQVFTTYAELEDSAEDTQ